MPGRGTRCSSKAAPRLHARIPTARFRIVVGAVPGDESTEQSLLDRLDSLDKRPDPFPNVVLEAIAECRAVVGSRLGGIPEMIDDGATGRVVEPGSSVDLADALEFLLGDRERAAGMGQAGLERARAEFSRAAFEARWRDMISRHLHAQNALVAAKGGSPLGEE